MRGKPWSEPVRINVLESVVYFRKCALSWTDEDQLFSSDLNNQRIQLTGTGSVTSHYLSNMERSLFSLC